MVGKDKDLERFIVQKTVFIVTFIRFEYIYKTIMLLKLVKLTAFEPNVILAHYIKKKLATWKLFLNFVSFCYNRKPKIGT